MHLQEYCAAAIEQQLDRLGGSCGNIRRAVNTDAAFEVAVLNEYRKVSTACHADYGFRNVGRAEWFHWSARQRQNYRLEMLYYFWMANQNM